jgi:putative addiction module CopG family antidote
LLRDFILPFTALDGRTGLTFISAMTITLTAEQEQFIAEQLKDGHYRSAGDVIVQSLGMLRAQEEFIRSNAAELREKIASGMGQIRRGETVDGKTAIQNLRKKLHQRERGGQ